MQKIIVFVLSVFILISAPVRANSNLGNWEQIISSAQGQYVYLYAWGGSPEVNKYLEQISKEVFDKYSIYLKHVKFNNIRESIDYLIVEKSISNHNEGDIDLLWVNGENFKTLLEQHLLFGPIFDLVPNTKNLNKKLPIKTDFTLATKGYEIPWGVGQFIFLYNKDKIKIVPKTFNELLKYAQKHPGRVSYPRPPDFHGVSFLKSLLLELTLDKSVLQDSIKLVDAKKVTAPLWDYLDKFHQVAWKKGKAFPRSSAQILQLLDDDQLDFAVSFNPNADLQGIENGTLAPSIARFNMQQGALTNLHFLAIPQTAQAKEGALVVINYLLTKDAQVRKSDIKHWGDPAVITLKNLKQRPLLKVIDEPHPSWSEYLAREWQRRYGR